MNSTNQLCFSDELLARRRKSSQMAAKLKQIEQMVDWQPIYNKLTRIDKTSKTKGGRPRKPISWMVKALFLQSLFNLSNPQLEDQLIDRLSFQRFVGINLDNDIPDFTTFWRFKEAIIEQGLGDVIFDQLTAQLEQKGLMLKKGTIVDATIIESVNRPLSDRRRAELAEKPSVQIDTDARSTKKRGKYYFGYKGHIGMDAGTKLIRKQRFSPANRHDQVPLPELISYDEMSLWGDKAYYLEAYKGASRKEGWFYGVLDKPNRGEKLSQKQKDKNKKFSSVRAQVEHPFAWMKTKAGLVAMRAKNIERNALTFANNCACWNVTRAIWLLRKQKPIGGLVCL
jgi:IS5 family transposase